MDTRLLTQLPVEQNRCREIARQYQAMGSIGCFAAALIEQAIRRADRAVIDGGEEQIRAALQDLQSYQTVPPQPVPLAPLRRPATERLRRASAMPPVGRRPGNIGLPRAA